MHNQTDTNTHTTNKPTALDNNSMQTATNPAKSGSSFPTQLPRLDMATAFLVPPPPLDFVLPGLPKSSVGSLVAPGATGKSWVGLQLAASVAGGRDFFNFGFQQYGRVLVVAAEDPTQVLCQRIHTLGEYLTADQRVEVINNVRIAPMLAAGVNLRSDEWVDLICKEGDGYRLIIIDTLSRVHDGDENDRRDASPIMRNLERIAANTQAAVVFLHHVSKSTALAGQSDAQQASRGSSVWVDESRWVAFLKTMDEKEAKKLSISGDMRRSYVRLGVSKQNYGAPVKDRWLQRVAGGVMLPADIDTKPATRSARAVKAVAPIKGVEICHDVPF